MSRYKKDLVPERMKLMREIMDYREDVAEPGTFMDKTIKEKMNEINAIDLEIYENMKPRDILVELSHRMTLLELERYQFYGDDKTDRYSVLEKRIDELEKLFTDIKEDGKNEEDKKK